MTTKHPETIEGPRVADWEPLGQVEPKELPEPSEKYPGPWETSWRGNGHVDVIDGQDRMFAHVYLWDGDEMRTFLRKTRAATEWAIEMRAPMSKQAAAIIVKHQVDERAKALDDTKRPFDEWQKLLEGR